MQAYTITYSTFKLHKGCILNIPFVFVNCIYKKITYNINCKEPHSFLQYQKNNGSYVQKFHIKVRINVSMIYVYPLETCTTDISHMLKLTIARWNLPLTNQVCHQSPPRLAQHTKYHLQSDAPRYTCFVRDIKFTYFNDGLRTFVSKWNAFKLVNENLYY